MFFLFQAFSLISSSDFHFILCSPYFLLPVSPFYLFFFSWFPSPIHLFPLYISCFSFLPLPSLFPLLYLLSVVALSLSLKIECLQMLNPFTKYNLLLILLFQLSRFIPFPLIFNPLSHYSPYSPFHINVYPLFTLYCFLLFFFCPSLLFHFLP